MVNCTSKLEGQEKLHGTLVSVLAGLLYFGAISVTDALKVNKAVSVPVLTFGINFIGHALDIIVAKKCFTSFTTGEVHLFPYTSEGLRKRALWYLRSLFTSSFLRFVLLSYTDALVVTRTFEIIDAKLEEWGVMTSGFWMRVRDPLVLGFLGVATFLVYVNILRFEWAYTVKGDVVLTTMVVFWACFMTFGTSPLPAAKKKKEEEEEEEPAEPGEPVNVVQPASVAPRAWERYGRVG